MEKVVTPPYDVISLQNQKMYYEKDPFNVVRLDFGMIHDTDGQTDNRYSRAARTFEEWQDQAVLVRDSEPSLYLYHVTYACGGRTYTRKGFLCLVRLEDFASGIIRPHEKTFPKVTSDRLELIEHCGANFSPVFSLYNDPDSRVMHVLDKCKGKDPLLCFYDEDGLKHEVWAVKDQTAIGNIQLMFDKEMLLIADGHHRYTTGLQYREKMRAGNEADSEESGYNYIMMYLCALEDDGLLILPTHRFLANRSGTPWEELQGKVGRYFDVEKIPLETLDSASCAQKALSHLQEAAMTRTGPSIGFYDGEDKGLYILSTKEGVMEEIFGREIPGCLLELDVVVLSELLIRKIMGLQDSHFGDIIYSHDACELIKRAESDPRSLVFLLNPTRIEQLRDVTAAGLVMPHKSTYFYPKVLTGLVINKVLGGVDE